MKTIITRVENNRIAKFIEVKDTQDANAMLAVLIKQYPGSFISDGAYSRDLWVQGGQVSVVPVVEPKVLNPLSAWQVRKVLRQFNMLDTVKLAVSQADELTQEAWEYATEFKRDDAVLNAMAQVIGLTDEQLDNLFEVGITL